MLSRMAMGTRDIDQAPLWVVTSDLPKAPSHPFYTRLNELLDAFNLTNRVNEVEERVVTGPGFRAVTAVQPPRAVHIGARMTF